MKKFYLSFLMTLCIFSCQAEIKPVDTMEEVFSYFMDANTQTLAIFDVDMVLVQPSDPAFQMANMKRFGAICKRMIKSVPPEKQMTFLSLMTTSSPPLLIDPNTPKILDKIAKKKIPTMALTANLTGELGSIKSMEQWRIDNLRTLGIDFSQNAPYSSSLVFDNLASYRGNYSTYVDGMLFVNGTAVSKGEAFLAFLEKTKLSPSKIIFIDDKEENLQSLESALKKLENPPQYLGLHFTGAQKYPSKEISEKDFEAKWQELALQATKAN